MKILALSGLVLAIVATAYFALSGTGEANRATSAVVSGDEGAADGMVDAQPLASSIAPHLSASIEDSSVTSEAQAPPAYLPSEQRVLGNGGINVDAVDRQFEDPQFKTFVDQFERDAASDALATQLTNSTRTQIEQQLRAGSQQLDRFACGLTLCVGSIRATHGAPTDWWHRLGDGKEVKAYVFLDASVALGTQETEQRFVFSIDPRVRGMIGSANPGKR